MLYYKLTTSVHNEFFSNLNKFLTIVFITIMYKLFQYLNIHFTEYQMMQFYHCCDYSLQVTKVYVNEHFRFRHVFPELFAVAESPPPRYMDPFWHVV